jgi:hypothetical protein
LVYYLTALPFGLVLQRTALIPFRVKTQGSVTTKPFVKGDMFTIEFADENFSTFGTKYTLKLEGQPEAQEYLVHFPSFLRYFV